MALGPPTHPIPVSLGTPTAGGSQRAGWAAPVPIRSRVVSAASSRELPQGTGRPCASQYPRGPPPQSPAPYSHDGTLGEGQVVHQHVQPLVLIVEELTHPPTAPGTHQGPEEPATPPASTILPTTIGTPGPVQGWGGGSGGIPGLRWRLQPLCYHPYQRRHGFICRLQGREGSALGTRREAELGAGCWGSTPSPSPGHPRVGGIQGAPAPLGGC